MQFGGWQKVSLIDFPQHIAAIVFTQGCPFRCRFCHNPSLVFPEQFTQPISEAEVLLFLQSRKNKLDGLVISGGEPTIHATLIPFIQKVRSLGLAIKLDTNGIRPDVLETLIQEKLVDYIAMDIKSSLEGYTNIIGAPVYTASLQSSISTIMTSGLPYEFRSTIVPLLHSFEEIVRMAQLIQGADLYILQQFRPSTTLDPALQKEQAYSSEIMELLCERASPFVKKCFWR